jgi:hypothetical protein
MWTYGHRAEPKQSLSPDVETASLIMRRVHLRCQQDKHRQLGFRPWPPCEPLKKIYHMFQPTRTWRFPGRPGDCRGCVNTHEPQILPPLLGQTNTLEAQPCTIYLDNKVGSKHHLNKHGYNNAGSCLGISSQVSSMGEC